MKNRKTLALVLAVVLLLTATVAGTLAWLIDTTPTVQNTFTSGDVDITLMETDLADGAKKEGVENEYQLIPGTTYTKDPTVAVVAGSEACYLYVEVIETNNPSTYLTYTLTLTSDGWQKLDGVNNVYYREISATEAAAGYTRDILTGNQVVVKDTVGGAVAMPNADAEPSITFNAYAIQKDNTGTAAEAWAKLVAQTTPTT